MESHGGHGSGHVHAGLRGRRRRHLVPPGGFAFGQRSTLCLGQVLQEA